MRARTKIFSTVASLLLLAATLLFAAPAPSAAAGTCIDDVTGVTNNCTANDVNLAIVFANSPVVCESGQYAEIALKARVVATSAERWDIGMFIALDGGTARTGTCYHDFLHPASSTNADLNVTGGFGPFYDGELAEDPADLCGDLEQGVVNYYDLGSVRLLCEDVNGDGLLDVGSCVSWDNAESDGGNKKSCLTAADAVPNTKAKCKCETVTVGNVYVSGKILVVKETEPAGATQSFAFTLSGGGRVTNFSLEGGQTFTSVPLKPGQYSVAETVPGGWEQVSVSCSDGSLPTAVSVSSGETVTCTFKNRALNPALTLVKTAAPATYDAVGDVISYSYELTSSGNATVSGPFTVSDDKATVSCPASPSELTPGSSITCTATHAITQADLDAGSLTNTARGKGTFYGTDVLSNEDSETVDAVQKPALSLVKTATPASYDSVGDVISYSYLLSNSGNVTLAGPFTVSDDKATVSCPADTTLAVGASVTCTASYTIAQADLDAGSVKNTAQGKGSFNGQDVLSNFDDETVTADQKPAISIVKSTNGADANEAPGIYILVGDSVTWTYAVENTGNVTLTNVAVSDDQGVTVSCPATSLAPGGAMTCTASGIATEGQYTNVGTATAVGPFGAPVTASDVSHYFGSRPSIAIDKTPDTQTVAKNGTASFTITVTNTGNVDLSSVTVVDPLSPDCAKSLGTLAAGASAAPYTCTAVAAAEFTNVATASGIPPVGPAVSAEDSAFVDVLPAIQVTKTPDSEFLPTPGGTVTFTVVVTNNSVEPVTLNEFADDIYGALDKDDPAHTWVSSTCELGGTLPAGGSYTCSFDGSVTGAADTTHTNTVSVTAADDENNSAAATAQATVTIIPAASLITSSSLCEYDADPTRDGDQFRLLYRMEAAPNVYRLNSSNPGQYYYNAFVSGAPGEAVNLTMTIPYPFVTHGAQPVHAYSTYRITSNGAGGTCVLPGTDVTAEFSATSLGGTLTTSGAAAIVLGDYDGLGSFTTVTVTGTIPATGRLYVNIHLDYGLKKTSGWVKNGEAATGSGAFSGTVIGEPQAYSFEFASAQASDSSQSTQSVNEFKKPAGFLGFVENTAGEPVGDVLVQVINSKGVKVGEVVTDGDGYYYLAYKHTAKAATYTVKLPAHGRMQSVVVKSNGFGIVDFEIPAP